ncbi:MAG: FliH/SctL family protein [Rhodospirillaceae bacterium]|nr:FliH/SctL family protein [Rhodospirillaceae bacterium]
MITAENMAGAEIKKFLFDNDFTDLEPIAPIKQEANPAETDESEEPALDENSAAPEEEVIEEIIPTFSQEEVDRAKEEGIQLGRDEALKDLEGSLQKKLAETMQALEGKLADIADEQARQNEERARSAVAIASVMMRKLFPALNMKSAMDEINHMIAQAMEKTSGGTSIVFHVSDQVTGDVETKISELAALAGRDIEFKVVGSADMALGDCKIEWSGGGLTRNQAQMWNEIDEIIERNIGTITATDDVGADNAEQGQSETVIEPDQGENDKTDEQQNENPL